jgi:hypothetical protein
MMQTYMGVKSDGEKKNDELRRLDMKTDNSNAEIIDDNDRAMLRHMVAMYNNLSGDQINLNNFKNTLDALEQLKKVGEHEYMNSLIHPESTKGAKLPSDMPIPSASFPLKQSFSVTTNSLGNATVVLNPYFLAGNTTQSTLFINNAATNTLTITDNNFVATNFGQAIPAVYNKYRLVSGSLIARYNGRLDIVQGNIGAAIIFDDSVQPTNVGSTNANLAKYADYNLAQDSYFQQEHYSLEGVRTLYFPIDLSFHEYQTLGTSRNGFAMLIYINGAPPSVSSFKFDICLNFECLPSSEFLNYIPTSLCQLPRSDIERALPFVRDNAVMSSTSYKNEKTKGDFWGKVLSKFGSIVPAIGNVAELVYPQFKSVNSVIQGAFK